MSQSTSRVSLRTLLSKTTTHEVLCRNELLDYSGMALGVLFAYRSNVCAHIPVCVAIIGFL
jgi:hypothetical protein